MDLLERNYTVHVLADGVSSRTMVERMFALEVTHLFKVLVLFSVIVCIVSLLVQKLIKANPGRRRGKL